jgi:chemosensory pili system protein ChpA (sensor histidine kinase/response regulator)
MDVVVSEIKQMGGALKIHSEWGKGADFILNLPLTLAVTDSLLMKQGEDIYAVPHIGMEGVVRVSREDLLACYDGRKEGFEYAGNTYVLRYLGGLLGTSAMQLPEQQRWFPVLLVKAGEHRVGLQVDELLGNREVVVKPLGQQLNGLRWLSGGTILADGQVALILDAPAVVRMDAARTVVTKEEAAAKEAAAEPKRPARKKLQVMVVDDSITVRKVTTRFLNRHNMDVVTAKDGVDAVAQLQEIRPDIMLLDVEMPRMDGYELARHVKHSDDLKEIPIIMITSRTGEKHRNVAKELGVERYLGKPYQETELLENIKELTTEAEMQA